MPETFFFINKTASSTHLTRGKASETTAIQHFVQTGRKRARKRKVLSAFKQHPLSKTDAQPASNSALDVMALPWQKRWQDQSNEGVPTPTVQDEATVDYIAHASSLPSPSTSYNLSATIDPFQVTSIRIDSEVKGLLNYYVDLFHPSLWPNEALALRSGAYVFEGAVNWVVQMSLHDSLTMYCLLAASVSRLRNVDNLPCTAALLLKQDQFISQALKLMQRRIDQVSANTNTDLFYLLNSMIFLSAAEAYRDNLGASKTHLKACISLLAFLDMTVVHITNQDLQGRIIMSDLFLSCMNLEPCLFRSEDYDPGPAIVIDLQPSELLELPLSLASMAESFQYNAMIQVRVKKLTSQIKEAYTIKRRLNTAYMSPARTLRTTHWITKRTMAIKNCLLSTFSPHDAALGDAVKQIPYDSYNDLLDKALRTALIQFILVSMNITGRVKTVKTMSRHLQVFMVVLLSRREEYGDTEDKLFLWLLVIGYTCAQDGSETEKWFGDKCYDFLTTCGIWETDYILQNEDGVLMRLELVQSGYFYDEYVQRPRLRKMIHHCSAQIQKGFQV